MNRTVWTLNLLATHNIGIYFCDSNTLYKAVNCKNFIIIIRHP